MRGRWISFFALTTALGAGCRSPGLTVDPGTDAADPEAAASEPSLPTNHFEVSAFEGQTLEKNDHAHHHMGHGKAAPKATEEAP
jgi:hypothetical protein